MHRSTFNVSTVNLTADLLTARPDVGSCDFGEIEEARLLAMLEVFRDLDPLQNLEADPQIIIESQAGKFVIQTGQRRLFLSNARDAIAGATELEPAEILREVQRTPLVPEESPPPPDPERTPGRHRAIAIAILLSGLLLNGYTLYSVFYVDDVNQRPAVELVTDARELTALRNSVVGRYATGSEPGDRRIEITRDGKIRFARVGTTKDRQESDDTYRIGRFEGKVCLATPDSGVVQVNNIESIVYYRDTYRRIP